MEFRQRFGVGSGLMPMPSWDPRILSIVWSGLLSSVLLGCLPYTPVKNPKPPVEVPEKFSHGDVAKNAGGRWWESFEDPQLNKLVETALVANLDMHAAWARLEATQAGTGIAGASLWPTLGLNAEASYRNTPSRQLPNPACNPECPTGQPETLTLPSFVQQSYDISVPVSYEVDLFGKIRGNLEAADIEVLATRDDVEALAISTSAATAEAWFNLIADNARIETLERQLEANEKYLQLVTLRFEKGLSSAVDVYQQQSGVLTTKTQLKSAEFSQSSNRNVLTTLLGRAPGKLADFSATKKLPVPPAFPHTGIPAHLLVNRPDIRGARLRVESADIRVGVAIADYFPSLTLRGGINWGNPKLSDLFDELLWSIAGSLSQQIFSGFRTDATVEQQQAIVRQQLIAFGKILISALVEVENAIAGEKKPE